MTLNSYNNPSTYVNGANYPQPREGERDGTYDSAHNRPHDRSDPSMEQIRDLIIGDLRRTWDARLATLETRLQMLEDKLEAVRHETRADRQGHLSALAEGLDDLSQHVRRLTR